MAKFKHKSDGAFSDGWVACNQNKMKMALLKCYSDGTVEIDGRTGNEIILPTCDPIGCDPEDLGPFNSKEYGKSDGCKKGSFELNGKRFENDKNNCFRLCGENGDIKLTGQIELRSFKRIFKKF